MSEPVRVFYKGNKTDLIIFIHTIDDVKNYVANPDIKNLSNIVETFQVFTNSEGRGSGGELGQASGLQIENEFGEGKKIEEIMDLIIRKGVINGVDKAISNDTFQH